MKIRKVVLAYSLLATTLGSSATALAVVPDCRTKVAWVMTQVKNRVTKATLERWKAWGIKHPGYKPPVTSRRPSYKSVWVRASSDQLTCFPEEASKDLWPDTTNADTEVGQLESLPQVLAPVTFRPYSPLAAEAAPGSSTATAGQQNTASGQYYPISSGAGIGGGYYFYPFPPASGTTTGTPTTIANAPPVYVDTGTTVGTPISPAITSEPSSLVLLATGLFGMALILARFGGSSTRVSGMEEIVWPLR